jgi:hypothetical protein
MVFLIGLFIVALSTTIIINKIPTITDKISKIPEKLEIAKRTINFRLNSPIAVKIDNKLSTSPLKLIRSNIGSGTLRVNPNNQRYFTDDSGKAIYLTGSHTWANFMDNGLTDPPPVFDYEKYLDFLVSNNHNFFRLWIAEQAKWITETTKGYWFSPLPYERVGQEAALDGKPKFDLTKFNQGYFDRLRDRVIAAKKRGIYTSIMLFNGWSIEDKNLGDSMTPSNPWRGHPYHRDNNINGIDGDPNKNGRGEETHTLTVPEITTLQEAYVRKVIDTVNDLDNVLYEISNESPAGSHQWQYHLIDYIKNYELKLPKQHPVGMTAEFPNGDNSKLYNSPADWISLKNDGRGDILHPPKADGKKVIISDTDHLCGVCGDRTWVWKSFTQGENPIFMDDYDGAVTLSDPSIPPDPLHYQRWISIRKNLGYALTYANSMNLAAMTPRTDLASTGYCLANAVEMNAEYLIYAPSGGEVVVDLSAAKGDLTVEWLNPNNGLTFKGIKIASGGNRSFIPPFKGDAVLYLKGI